MEQLGSVFVIGGCGLLGHHIVKHLLESTEVTHIVVFDVSTKNNRIEDIKIHYVTGSITSRNDLLNALRDAKTQVIINTASPDPLIPVPKLLEDVNITGTRNVIDCAIELGIKILVYSSSSEVVQRSYEDMHFVDETCPLPEHPVDGAVYSRTKKIGEEMVLTANGNNGLHTAAIRPCTIFGECDRVLTKHSIEMVHDGRAKFHIGNGRNLYDFIYAGNAAEAHILAAKTLLSESRSRTTIPPDRRVSGEAFFITNGDPWPFWDFTTAVSVDLEKPIGPKDIWHIQLGIAVFFVKIVEWVTWTLTLGGSPSITANMIKYTAQKRTFSIAKARERLGYRPRVDMKEGIKRAVGWHLSNSPRDKST